jgi:hypothetical protein
MKYLNPEYYGSSNHPEAFNEYESNRKYHYIVFRSETLLLGILQKHYRNIG